VLLFATTVCYTRYSVSLPDVYDKGGGSKKTARGMRQIVTGDFGRAGGKTNIKS
jgi:hypothetical protein